MQEGGQIQKLPGQRLCIDWLCVGLLQEDIHYAGGNVALPMYVLTMSIWIFLHCEW